MDKINKMPQVIFRVIFIICIVLSMLIMLSFLFNKNKIPGIFKYKPVVVESNTSISSIKKGDLVIIKDISKNQYKKDNIIVFRGDKRKNVLSKIEDIKNDKFILSRNIKIDKYSIQGIKKLRIPLLGYFVMFLQSLYGFIITFILILISVIWYKCKSKKYKNI